MEKLIVDQGEYIYHLIIKFGGLLYNRSLTDSSGGNISIRYDEESILITPKHAGSKYFWDLTKNNVCKIKLSSGQLISDNHDAPSRELAVHQALHKHRNNVGTCVIHAHPKNLLSAAMMGFPILPVLENVMKFDVIPVIPFAKACTEALANNVVDAICAINSSIDDHPKMVIAPFHGVFTVGASIESAFDCIERLEQNAFCLINLAHANKDIKEVNRKLTDFVNA